MKKETDRQLTLFYQQVQQLLSDRTGIAVPHCQESNFIDAIERARERFGYESNDALLIGLEVKGPKSQVMEYLVSRITAGESFFFQDDAHYRFLQESWLPKIIAEKRARGNHSLRIWSAGCSTGEEIYSLAMLIKEALPSLSDWNIHLLGSDVNTQFLKKAIKGEYDSWSFRNKMVEPYMGYFLEDKGNYTLSPEIRDMVKFDYLNLFENTYPAIMSGTTALDLIFCRNVMYYFEEDVIEKMLDRLSRALTKEGVLLVCNKDLMSYRPKREILLPTKRNFIFIKANSHAKEEKKTPIIVKDKKVSTASSVTTDSLDSLEKLEEKIIAAIRLEQWHEVISLTQCAIEKHGKQSNLLQWQAKGYANLGEMEKAIEATDNSLLLDKLDHHTYLIKGLIELSAGEFKKAEENLKRCIELDPKMFEAHYILGILFLKIGNIKEGIHFMNDALDLVIALPLDRYVHTMRSLTCERFTEILKQELKVYQGAFSKHE